MSEIHTNKPAPSELSQSSEVNPGDVFKHCDGLSYRVLDSGLKIDDSGDVTPTIHYVQLEEGGMPAGTVWSRSAEEFAGGRVERDDTELPIFSFLKSENPDDPEDGVVPVERAPQESDPRLGATVLGGSGVVTGYGYDVSGYERTHDFSTTVMCRLTHEHRGVPTGTLVELDSAVAVG